MFTKSQHLMELLPIMRVSVQRTKEEQFCTFYLVEVKVCVVISKHFTWKLIIETLPQKKQLSSEIYCVLILIVYLLFHDGGRYHIETSRLICRANQWTGFYMITASAMKELSNFSMTCIHLLLMFRRYQKDIFLLSSRFWEVLHF